jgi:hypothetical protein
LIRRRSILARSFSKRRPVTALYGFRSRLSTPHDACSRPRSGGTSADAPVSLPGDFGAELGETSSDARAGVPTIVREAQPLEIDRQPFGPGRNLAECGGTEPDSGRRAAPPFQAGVVFVATFEPEPELRGKRQVGADLQQGSFARHVPDDAPANQSPVACASTIVRARRPARRSREHSLMVAPLTGAASSRSVDNWCRARACTAFFDGSRSA